MFKTKVAVGIDAAKGKSTVFIMNDNGEVLKSSFDVNHTKSDLNDLKKILDEIGKDKDIKVVMEATGVYHWPIFSFLKRNGYFVSIINPLVMKIYSKSKNFRNVKTDKIDAGTIALYTSETWNSLKDTDNSMEDREKLKVLTRAYDSYQKAKVNLEQILDLELEKAMPGIKDILEYQKLYDFVKEFIHFDNISKLKEEKFLDKFDKWANKKGYRFQNRTKQKIYECAKDAIPTALNDDITKLTVMSAINSVEAINASLNDILTRAKQIASTLPEYETVRNMSGVGDTLAPLLISEIGDIRLIHNKKALVCIAGIDVPPYESGQFKASKRKISKKGNSHLRRHLYLVMKSIHMSKPKEDNAVYEFMIKKKNEHKHIKQVYVAGMRKFLHIYYARVKELYKELGIWDIPANQ